MPDTYDRCLGPALFAPFAAHLAAMAAQLSPRHVLELAAGTGIATAELVRTLPAAHITATDLNPAMVSWAADRIGGATWMQADAQRLDLPDASFDLVACQFGVMFFPDKQAAFAEAARVMAPMGTMLFTVWDVVEASHFPAALVASLDPTRGPAELHRPRAARLRRPGPDHQGPPRGRAATRSHRAARVARKGHLGTNGDRRLLPGDTASLCPARAGPARSLDASARG